MAHIVYFRGNRELVRNAVIQTVRGVTGNADTHLPLARGVLTAIGLAALGDIKSDFVRKARGETGEDGNTWPKLTKKYLAYGRRFGPGEQAALKRAEGLGRGHRLAPGNNKGLLTAAQLKRWRGIFASVLARLAASMDLAAAKARAAQVAWAILKREGARTKLDVFGSRQVEILRDTGDLLNSLSPGEFLPTGEYTPPADQIWEIQGNGIIIGSKLPYARAHNRGYPPKKIPARPFLPVDRIPAVWAERWQAAANRATATAIATALQGGAA